MEDNLDGLGEVEIERCLHPVKVWIRAQWGGLTLACTACDVAAVDKAEGR